MILLTINVHIVIVLPCNSMLTSGPERLFNTQKVLVNVRFFSRCTMYKGQCNKSPVKYSHLHEHIQLGLSHEVYANDHFNDCSSFTAGSVCQNMVLVLAFQGHPALYKVIDLKTLS